MGVLPFNHQDILPDKNSLPNVYQLIFQDSLLVYYDDFILDIFDLSKQELSSTHKFIHSMKACDNTMGTNLDQNGFASFKIHREQSYRFFDIYHKQVKIADKFLDIFSLYEISHNVSIENRLKDAYAFEKLVRSITNRFTHPEASMMDENIIYCFKDLGKFTGVDRIFLFLVDENDPSIVVRTHEWHNKDVNPLGNSFRELKRKEFDWIDSQLEQNEIVVFHNVDDIPQNAIQIRESFIKFGIKSILLMPLFIEERYIGFLGLDTIKSSMQFTDKMISTLKIIGEIIVNGLSRKFTKDQLIQSEERFFNLMDHSPFGVGIHQNDKIVYVNQVALDIIGAESEEEVIGLSALSLISSEQQEFAAKRVQRVYDYQVLDPVYYTFNRLDGKPINVELLAIPIIYNGNVASQVIFRDITMELEAQKRIAESEDRYRTLFETSIDPIFITSPNGKLIEANSAFIEMFGYEKEEIFSLNVKELYYDPNDRLELLDTLRNQGMVKNYELQLKNKEGSKLYVMASISVKTNENGEMVRFEGVFKNITEEKAARDQLMQTEKLKSIGVLAEGMAHDFNNILTSIKGYGSILMEHLNDPKLKNLSSEIIASAEDATKLTSQLLSYAGIETDAHQELLTLNKELQELKKFIKITLPSHVEISYAINQTGIVKTNKGQISRIILNILRNSYESMEGTKGTIKLTTGQLEGDLINPNMFDCFRGEPKADVNYSYIEIQDEGGGIPSRLINQIFEPSLSTSNFFRGFGLAPVWESINEHNGLMGINSKIDYGTTTYIFLPQIPEEVPQIKQLGETKQSTRVEEFNLNVVLVDDEQTIREVSKKLLESLGCRVKLLPSGFELLRELEDNMDYDVIIIDLTMPNLNGIDTIQKIRSRKISIPIILTSGYPKKNIVNKYALYRISDFLPKPYDLNDLRAILSRLFN